MTGIWGERLTNLRQVLKRQGLTGLIVSRAYKHLCEYVPASAARLAWLSDQEAEHRVEIDAAWEVILGFHPSKLRPKSEQ